MKATLLLAILGVLLLGIFVVAHLMGAATSGTTVYGVVGGIALLAALVRVTR